MIQKEVKEFSVFWMVILLLTVISFPVFWSLNAAGILGTTIIEREVFRNSYQYQASQESKQNTIAAQLVEIEHMLADKNLDPGLRRELEAKARALRVLANSR